MALILTLFACGGDDGGDSSDPNFGAPVPMSNFTFDDIEWWVGSGPDSAMMYVQWNDNINIPDGLVWGYLFNAGDNVTGAKMIYDIMMTDTRFYLLAQNTQYGISIGGIGFAPAKNMTLLRDGYPTPPDQDSIRLFRPQEFEDEHLNPPGPSTYDYDLWTCPACSKAAHWESGQYVAYWYYFADVAKTGAFAPADSGASNKHLQNGSRNAWNFTDLTKYPYATVPPYVSPYPPFLSNWTPVLKP
jgi:hypothetical protein